MGFSFVDSAPHHHRERTAADIGDAPAVAAAATIDGTSAATTSDTAAAAIGDTIRGNTAAAINGGAI